MLPAVIRTTALVNWLLAAAFVAATNGLADGGTLGGVAVMAALAALGLVTASLIRDDHRPLAVLAGLLMVGACGVTLSVGVLMLPAAFVALTGAALAVSSRHHPPGAHA